VSLIFWSPSVKDCITYFVAEHTGRDGRFRWRDRASAAPTSVKGEDGAARSVICEKTDSETQDLGLPDRNCASYHLQMPPRFQRFPPLRRDASTAELCNLFMARSVETWSLLRRARLVNVSFKEESITDLHLLAFSEAGIEGFSVQGISRQDERANGADYEWWFGDRSGRWLGMRVQAKRVDHKETLRALNYLPAGATITQSRALMDTCLKLNMLPTYCLYLYSGAFLEPLHGCSLLSPFIVSAFKPNSKITLAQVNRCLVPWTLLVCTERSKWQPISNDPSLTDVVLEGWRNAMGYGYENRPRDLEVSGN
jgi:hypothetical protein